ncbi:hypothetical protein HYW76_05365 [Candidatus Pacearchaeota archaeon]|nr:hypothetical protein [Candidatus Pacearchaeota archaeon]
MSQDIKEAFERVKQDISYLYSEIQLIKQDIADFKSTIPQIKELFESINTKMDSLLAVQKTQEIKENLCPTDIPTHPTEVPTIQHINPTHFNIPTHNLPLYELKSQNNPISTGNEGVPTDRQADRQADQQILQHIPTKAENPLKSLDISLIKPEFKPPNHLERVSEILDSLDSLKKEVRLKFKRLTIQEMAVFSLLYSLEEQGDIVDYKLLSSKLSLSESSIRDYVHKIIAKGIPILKEKVNNKRIVIHISPELKKIASLETISRLREI